MAAHQLCGRVVSHVILRLLSPALPQIRRFIRAGDRIPDIPLYENSPTDAVSPVQLYKDKRGVMFSVVGAFTPGCTQSHIPEYIENFEKFKEEGYDLISCVAVNDPFVMSAWGRDVKAEGKIRMLADPRGEFTRALGMELDCTKVLGGWRSKRFSVVIEDGVIQQVNEDPDHTGLVCLLCIKNMKGKTDERT